MSEMAQAGELGVEAEPRPSLLESAETPRREAGSPATEARRTGRPEKNVSGPERWASVAAGFPLMTFGLSQLEFGGIVSAAAGGYFLYRGFTGHCPLYERLGISSRAPRPMALRSDAEVLIDRPPEEVYAWHRQLENLAAVTKYLKNVKEHDPETSRWRARLPGGKLVEWTDRLAETPRVFMRLTSMTGLEHETELRFEPASQGAATEVRVRSAWHPRLKVRGLGSKMVEALGSMMVGAIVRGELSRIKEHLETGGTEAHPETARAESLSRQPGPRGEAMEEVEALEEAERARAMGAAEGPCTTGETQSPAVAEDDEARRVH